MAQATSGEIACYWLRRVTCRSVIFRIGPVWGFGFRQPFCLQENNERKLLAGLTHVADIFSRPQELL